MQLTSHAYMTQIDVFVTHFTVDVLPLTVLDTIKGSLLQPLFFSIAEQIWSCIVAEHNSWGP